MTRCLCYLLALIAPLALFSQQPQLIWGKSFDARNLDNPRVNSNGRSVAIDRQGNVYSAGLFNNTADFDPGPGIFTLKADNWAETSIYLSKLSSSGEFLWAIQIPAIVSFGHIEIAVDNNDNVLIASHFNLPVDMDPGPGTFLLTPIGGRDGFVAKYNPDGGLVWAKQFGGPGDTVPESHTVTTDKDNNVIVCGGFNNTVDFDPDTGVSNMTSTAHIQAFIVKLTSDGNLTWARQFGNGGQVYAGSVIMDVRCDPEGNIHMVGNFAGKCDFDPGPAQLFVQSNGMNDGFITKLNPNGELIWTRNIGNTRNEYYEYGDTRGLEIDAEFNVYVTGSFLGTFDFDPGPGTYLISSQNSSYDWFMMKLNRAGIFQWAGAIGGEEHETGADISVDNAGGVYATGSIGHVADVDPGPATKTITTVNEYGAGILTKLTADGKFVYAASFESNGVDYGGATLRRMTVDKTQNIYIAGSVSGNIDFDPGPDKYEMASGMDMSPIVLKLGPCKNATRSTVEVTTCNSYTFNNEKFDSTGTYVRTLTNKAGCDSVVTLRLTFNKKRVERSVNICAGTSYFAGGALQTVSGFYIDTLKTTSQCDSIVITHLSVQPVPLPDLGTDIKLCEGNTARLDPGVNGEYTWQDGSSHATLTVATAGMYWVRVTNEFNCTSTDTLVVQAILPAPADFLRASDSICPYQQKTITPASTYTKYTWSTGSPERSLTVDQPGLYKLIVTDANGCSGTDSIMLVRKDCPTEVFVPNAFTPGNDGVNDLFRAQVFGEVVSFSLKVFDRAGQLVFQSDNPAKGWDGSVFGRSGGAGVYVWQCIYQRAQQLAVIKKGTVTLIR